MKEEAWGPIWGLIGANGQNWLWWDKWQGREAAGEEQEVVGLAHKWAFLSSDRRLKDGGNPRGDGRTFLLEPPGDGGPWDRWDLYGLMSPGHDLKRPIQGSGLRKKGRALAPAFSPSGKSGDVTNPPRSREDWCSPWLDVKTN